LSSPGGDRPLNSPLLLRSPPVFFTNGSTSMSSLENHQAKIAGEGEQQKLAA